MIIRPIIRLYIIQLGAFLAVWLGSYLNGLDLILSLLFLAILFIEINQVNECSVIKRILIILAWQLPGIVISMAIITGVSDWFNWGQYLIFIMEFWCTPVLPLISIMAAPFLPQPTYYYLLLGMPFLLATLYIFISYKSYKQNQSAGNI